MARDTTQAAAVVILVGLPGAGKTTFFRQRFADSHLHVSKDNLRGDRRPARRQGELIAQALACRRSVVVDNVNATAGDRAAVIAEARRHGARVVGYFFDCAPRECVARNAARQGRARIPVDGIFAAAKRLARPTRAEGFDELYTVRPLPGERFEIEAA
jgi:predicted kinase